MPENRVLRCDVPRLSLQETKATGDMKITIQDGPFSYAVDWSVENKIDGGWLDEYHAPVDEMLDAVIHLLGCVYPEEKIEEELRDRYGDGKDEV